MVVIPDIAKKVPLMFQAQVNGRCQLQRLVPKAPEQDAVRWADEWIDKTYPEAPQFGLEVQTRNFTISWRFVTNGGQDDGTIRPVIGARGWPFYPGSSMKGIFARACTPEQRDCYCGRALNNNDFAPGLLRFHGGYPTDTRWTENLVDIVHPQQDRQVKAEGRSSAFVQISLYKPELQFGISSSTPLETPEWDTVWSIWKRAMSTGLGCRVCAGYGQPDNHTGDILYKAQIKGQGQAAKLLDGTGEFRPNILRASLRGHALRLFGGLTNAAIGEQLVDQLFGSTTGQGTVGLLSMSFRDSDLELDTFGRGSYEQPDYTVEGELRWLLAQKLPEEQQTALTEFIKALTRFAMVLGGFGKSWRRADHRLFYPDYYEIEAPKPLIGCHWQWLGDRSLLNDVRVRKLEEVGPFIDKVRQTAEAWMHLQGTTPNPAQKAPWRETWHPDNVQVWGRLANEAEDCEAIRWLHGPYRDSIPSARVKEGSIYRSSITGQMGQIGRLWHRMYPVVRLVKDPENPKKPIPKVTRQYLELVTLFPDSTPESTQLLQYLHSEQKQFVQLWPN